MIPLVSLYWFSFIRKHLNAQNESLFSTRNHFRFWICSNLMVKQDFALSWKTQLQSCAWFFCCFLLSLCVSTAAWWENRTAAGKKTRGKLCFWILRLGFRKHSANEMWPETRWGWQEVTLNVRNNSSSLALGSHVLIHGIKPKQSNTGTSKLFTTPNGGFLVTCKRGKSPRKAFLSRPFCIQYQGWLCCSQDTQRQLQKVGLKNQGVEGGGCPQQDFTPVKSYAAVGTGSLALTSQSGEALLLFPLLMFPSQTPRQTFLSILTAHQRHQWKQRHPKQQY